MRTTERGGPDSPTKPYRLWQISPDPERPWWAWRVVGRTRHEALGVVAGYGDGVVWADHRSNGTRYSLAHPAIIKPIPSTERVGQWSDDEGEEDPDSETGRTLWLTAREWVSRCRERGENHVTAPG